MKYIVLIFSAFLIFGCANKRIAQEYIKKQNYEKAYEMYLDLAKKGFPEAAERVARLIYLGKVNKPPYIERKYALYAYNHGYERAALYIADSYFKEKKFFEAFKWYNEVDFSNFSNKDFKNYLITLNNLKNVKEKIKYLNKLEKFAKRSKNPVLLRMLGKFYLSDSPYFNPQKAEELLKQAYKLGDYKAAVALGVFYIKNGQKDKGYTLLSEVLYKDKTAAFYIGNYLYDVMIDKEKVYNKQCITAKFNEPREFFVKKLTIYKFNDLFTRKNVKKAFDISYKLGNKKALYKLIRLDLEDNTYDLAKKTYSGFDLNQTIEFLNSQNDIESKLLLAKIYEKYLYLNSYKKAKKIYEWYENIDKINAIWNLYQYEKRFESKINFDYLNFLTRKDFVPAIIEKAYQEILLSKNIDKNKKILEYYANQDNILALNYLGSLYSKMIFLPKEKSFEYYKKACQLEKKPFYIPSEDLKIANYYLHDLKNEEKALSINYYYHQMKNPKAQINLALFYKEHCNYDKYKKMLSELVNEADKKGTFLYYLAVLQKEVNGDFQKAIEYMKNQDDPLAYVALGDIYAKGIGVNLDPKIAEYYYNKAIKKGYYQALLNLASMYERLNVNGIYNKKIINIYNEAIKKGINIAKIRLAKFYYSIGEINKAVEILKNINDSKLLPKARYLLFQYTGRDYFVRRKDTNYGYLLLVRAQKKARYNPKEALYYVFRAMLCNTPQSTQLAIELMQRINNAKIIEKIYQKAKEAPRCYIN